MATSFARAMDGLQARSLLSQSTAGLGPALGALLGAGQRVGVYAGFDPTAPSLHLGHASVVVMLQRLQREGLKPVALVGGATAMVGDPTGRSEERPLLTREAVAVNAEGIRACLSRVLDFTGGSAVLVDNADFYESTNVLDWLRDTGRHFRVSSMLTKDSVKSRLAAPSVEREGGGAPPTGLSFTEFAYQIFQAADYARLYASHGVRLQVGGSDQWGNITAGVELVRRSTGGEAHGLTLPLLTAADGRKFGKSEGNAVWLDPTLTPHHVFWQYLVRREDGEVGALLRQLTLLPEEEVEATLAEHERAPEKKRAQMLLADNVTRAFRGQEAVATAHRCAAVLYAGTALWGRGGEEAGAHLPQRALLPTLRASDLLELAASGDLPTLSLAASTSSGSDTVLALAVRSGLAKSKSDARRMAESGGLYWNWERLDAAAANRVPTDFIGGSVAVLSAGKRRSALLTR